MTTAISIEDVRREVKILKALSGHKHLVKFYDACEDANNVYIVMEYVFSFCPLLVVSWLKLLLSLIFKNSSPMMGLGLRIRTLAFRLNFYDGST